MDCCNSLCRAVWVSDNDIGAEGVRHLMDGLAAAGLSQLTSLNLACKSGFLLSWVGQGAALWVPRMEVLLCGVRMCDWLRCSGKFVIYSFVFLWYAAGVTDNGINADLFWSQLIEAVASMVMFWF